MKINAYLPSVKDKAHLARADKYRHNFFKPEVEKQAAKEAAEYAIYPTIENVEKLKKLLKDCPALLLHSVAITNRHDKVVKGTVYQIALHEADNELIDDVIKPAFEKLHNGLKMMKAQRQAWLPEGWLEAEERACASALTAIDNAFAAFKAANNPHDFTELQQYPFTITINNQGVNKALEAFRKAIGALYEATDKVITSGRDPIIRLLEQVIDRYKENYNVLGRDNTPHNNALLRAVYGYCQRFAPINFMQAFAQGFHYIVEEEQKLNRTFAYTLWRENFILPLDSDPLYRLGYDYFACGWGSEGGESESLCGLSLKTFLSIKNNSSTISVMPTQDRGCAIM